MNGKSEEIKRPQLVDFKSWHMCLEDVSEDTSSWRYWQLKTEEFVSRPHVTLILKTEKSAWCCCRFIFTGCLIRLVGSVEAAYNRGAAIMYAGMHQPAQIVKKSQAQDYEGVRTVSESRVDYNACRLRCWFWLNSNKFLVLQDGPARDLPYQD